MPVEASSRRASPILTEVVRIPPTAAGVRQGVMDMRERWFRRNMDADLLDRAELVLAEVLNNVVEHAQRNNQSGRIEVAFKPAQDGAEFLVIDDGQPMAGEELPNGAAPALGARAGDLPEGGFGWFLIRRMAHDLTYTRSDDTNCLSFRIPAAPPAG